MWLLYAVGASFFAGITAILVKIGAKDVDSHVMTALRTVVVAMFSWGIVFAVGSHKSISNVPLMTMIFLCVSGITTGISWICYFHALQIGNVNVVVPIDKSSVVLTIFLGVVFLGESINGVKILCVIFIAGGTYLMVERKEGKEAVRSKSAVFYALMSAVFASLTALLSKLGITGIESNLGTAIRTIVVMMMAWIIVFGRGKHKEISKISRKGYFFIILSGIVTGLSWAFYYRALQDGPISIVLPIDKLSTLVSIAFAYFVFGERLTRKSAFGLALIVCGTLGMVIL